MPRKLLFAIVLALAAPAVAQPTTSTVELSNFKFAPPELQLRAKTPTVLQLRNLSSGGHSFSAPAFFAAAQVDPTSAGLIRNGQVDVPAHSTVQVIVTPGAGQYPLQCTHPFHSTLGMKGVIVVR
jgi:uncharacterized cupredoxin-like copper-binding protein